MTFKEQVKLMEFIFRIYPRDWSYRLGMEEDKDYISQKRIKDHFDNALSNLNPEQRRIIRKEFIERCENGWWIEYYSKTTYYHYKKTGMELFLNCIWTS